MIARRIVYVASFVLIGCGANKVNTQDIADGWKVHVVHSETLALAVSVPLLEDPDGNIMPISALVGTGIAASFSAPGAAAVLGVSFPDIGDTTTVHQGQHQDQGQGQEIGQDRDQDPR